MSGFLSQLGTAAAYLGSYVLYTIDGGKAREIFGRADRRFWWLWRLVMRDLAAVRFAALAAIWRATAAAG